MSNCCNKNVLDTYNTSTLAVDVGSALSLQQNDVKVGNSICHAAGTTTITINCPGLYLVNFSAEGYATGGTGAIQVNLQNNGTNINGASSILGTSSSTNIGSLFFSKVIEVSPSCCAVNNTANLTFVNTDTAATYTSVNVNVIKL